MGKEVGVRTRAKQSEKGETRCDNYSPLARDYAPFTRHDSCGREDSDAGRKPDIG